MLLLTVLHCEKLHCPSPIASPYIYMSLSATIPVSSRGCLHGLVTLQSKILNPLHSLFRRILPLFNRARSASSLSGPSIMQRQSAPHFKRRLGESLASRPNIIQKSILGSQCCGQSVQYRFGGVEGCLKTKDVTASSLSVLRRSPNVFSDLLCA